MKKILLIDPIYNPGIVSPNIALGKIEAVFSKLQFKIDVLDFVQTKDCPNLASFLELENQFYDSVASHAADADIVYITTSHGNELKPYPVFPRIKKCVELIKKINPKIKVVVGGSLINFYCLIYKIPQSFFTEMGIDYVSSGNEFYQTINILESILDMKLDKRFPLISWNCWDWNKYPQYLSVMYHVGCMYKCDFCFEGKVFDKKQNTETLSSLINTISFAQEYMKINRFILEDSTTLSYPDFDDLIQRLQELKITFSGYARINEINKNAENVSRLKKAGCSSLIVGIETLNDSILKSQHKGLVSAETRKALDILKDEKIQVQGCFMLGFPDDDLKNMEKTIRFALDEKMNGYRWHIYQPNYMNLDSRFFSQTDISIYDHLKVQMNVPDNCLPELLEQTPEIMILDEHFLIRASRFLKDYSHLSKVGYKGCFTYRDICDLLSVFPNNLILNEERLYDSLFHEN